MSDFEYLYHDRRTDRLHRTSHVLESPPESLKKKATLLKHFKNHMQDNLTRPTFESPTYSNSLDYLTKYLRTKNAVVFLICNHTLQINFFDHTKLIVRDGIITYIDKSRQMDTRTIEWYILNGSSEVRDRISYCCDIAGRMVYK